MAAPKVFISSTCYDLREIRDSLYAFVKSFGFEPVLSEHGDVFYHPDLHTHEACVHEVGNCQLFILLIGGRFGGHYVSDKDKSVTNAEYDAAVKNGLPIFTYIKKSLLESHHIYQLNKEKPHIGDLDFPAIEKKSDAIHIFNFINNVRGASINNAYEGFEVSRDIENHLKKQWASMFFDFLKNRDATKQITQTSEIVSSLKNTSDRLEDLIKEVYRAVDNEHATSSIDAIERRSKAKTFFDRWICEFEPGYIVIQGLGELERLVDIEPCDLSWTEYLVELGVVEPHSEDDEEILYFVPDENSLTEIEGEWSSSRSLASGFASNKSSLNPYQAEAAKLYKEGVCNLSRDERYELISIYSKSYMEQ